jgi:DNA-binding NarL/FixJ family response regulator
MLTTVTTSKIIRVLVVDDHPFLREGVRAVISTQADLCVAAEATNGIEAVEQYRAQLPDVVLMDLQMPGMSGLEAIVAIRAEWPDARIVVLTTYSGDAQALRALRAGASGYILKSSLRKELLDTIRSVYAGGKHLDTAVATDIAMHVIEDALTDREISVLELAAAGNSNRAIGNRLNGGDGKGAHEGNLHEALGSGSHTRGRHRGPSRHNRSLTPVFDRTTYILV